MIIYHLTRRYMIDSWNDINSSRGDIIFSFHELITFHLTRWLQNVYVMIKYHLMKRLISVVCDDFTSFHEKICQSSRRIVTKKWSQMTIVKSTYEMISKIISWDDIISCDDTKSSHEIRFPLWCRFCARWPAGAATNHLLSELLTQPPFPCPCSAQRVQTTGV